MQRLSRPITATGPAPRAPSLEGFSTRFARRRLLDRVAGRVVTLGGLIVIAAILAILLVIAGEAYPLLRPARSLALPAVATGLAAPLGLDVDEYREIAVVVTASGISSVSLADGAATALAIPEIAGATITATSAAGRRPLAAGLSDGRVALVDWTYPSRSSGARRGPAEATVRAVIPALEGARPIRLLAHAAREGASVTAAVSEARSVAVTRVTEEANLLGETTREEKRSILDLATAGEVSALAIDDRGDRLFVGTTAGEVVHVPLRGSDLVSAAPIAATSRPGAGVTVLGFLLGDRTLVVGDEAGGVGSWQLLSRDGEPRLTRIHEFSPLAAKAVGFSASHRHKGFWVSDARGGLQFDYGTTGETLLSLETGGEPAVAIAFASRGDGLLGASADGRLLRWNIDCPHPEVSLRSLFGKVWYEGYDAPAFVWQSTGGTDDFEAKLSLTPLLFGTLKGTAYALLFAVPIALASALYASQFMHPRWKAVVKPTVEIMAATPSVVLGFLGGLWLAPNVERVVPGLLVTPLVVALLVLCALGLWRRLPQSVQVRLDPGTEVLILIPVVILGTWLSFAIGGWVELHWLSGDYRTWLRQVLGVTYDQRNSIVVGIAMGFAVVPVIFTIADDSLSNVPGHLTAGSLALGATRWQTAVRVVLPSASPGIFSAIMIGFGRAVGETMIVLMATGNTPVMSASIFNGFRALSANIAVELPEAPEGGTLFRVLFVAALLLFAMTFLMNTIAELVRLRLRARYRTL